MPVASLVNFCTGGKLRQRRDLRIQKGNEGSNRTLSASKSELQTKSAARSREMRETCPYFAIIPRQTGLQRTDCSAENGVTVPAFLRRAHGQSGFNKGLRRMQCDRKSGFSVKCLGQ
jgi:hypothetical protein